MRIKIRTLWKHLSLARQFLLACLVVLTTGMAGLGWWVSEEIQEGVTRNAAGTNALYVDSFVAPLIQELDHQDHLTPEHIARLDALLKNTPLGRQVVSFKIWDADTRIVYSTNPSITGKVYPTSEELVAAWQGKVTAELSDLEEEEDSVERQFADRLLEIYSPVRRLGTNRVIAVAEFYQSIDVLEQELFAARRFSWLIVAVATLAMFVLLVGIVRRGSDTIKRQRGELQEQVDQLTALLSKNEELHERVRRATTRSTELNERFLRRVSAELHDGPAQALGYALLRLDTVVTHSEACSCTKSTLQQANQDLNRVQGALREALDEMRTLAAGLALPELEALTIPETVTRVVSRHKRRTNSEVELTLDGVPDQAPLPAKITLYRLIQEALSNAYHHGDGEEQRVQVSFAADHLQVEISDRGQGFDPANGAARDQKLGLIGMRDRVESLGGTFELDSHPDQGTNIVARLPLNPVQQQDAQ